MNRNQLRRSYATVRAAIDLYTSAATREGAQTALGALWSAAAPAWLPIETAPPGEPLLGYYPSTKPGHPGFVREIFCSASAESRGQGYFTTGYYNQGPSDATRAIHPTHWMPLPSGPPMSADGVTGGLQEAIDNLEVYPFARAQETRAGFSAAIKLLRAMLRGDQAALVGMMLGERWKVEDAVGLGLSLVYQRGRLNLTATRGGLEDLWDLESGDFKRSGLTAAQLVTEARAAAERFDWDMIDG